MVGRPLSRRTLLKGGVAGALALAGCGGRSTPPEGAPDEVTHPSTTGPGGSAPGTVAPTTAAPTSAVTTGSELTTAALDEAAWAGLSSALSGHLVLPANASYVGDAQLYDFRYDGVRPAGIAYCATPDDVARCLAFARDHGLTPTPRGGGHSYGGYSTGTGLVVDVTPMASMRASGGQATVGAGARLIDVYSALNGQGVSIAAGSCPTVGIAGLALGGGLGVLGRLHGLTCDQITSLQVVTADSRIVTASAADNADLYWACRGGGGGNFGVVTSFGFATFPVADVSLFTLDWPWGAAAQVLPAWQHWAPAAPDALWSNCLLGADGSSATPSIKVTGVYVGSPGQAATLLTGLETAAGAPTSRFLESTSLSHAMFVEAGCATLSQAACHLPTQVPGGVLDRNPSVAKSDFLTAPLGDPGVATVLDALEARQQSRSAGAVAYDACGGAIGRVAPAATAFVHRDAICSAQYSVTLAPGDSPSFLAGAESWLAGLYSALRPYVSGQAYQNYIDPSLAGWAEAYYGANLGRLSQVKQAWDPDDVFHFAQSIPRA